MLDECWGLHKCSNHSILENIFILSIGFMMFLVTKWLNVLWRIIITYKDQLLRTNMCWIQSKFFMWNVWKQHSKLKTVGSLYIISFLEKTSNSLSNLLRTIIYLIRFPKIIYSITRDKPLDKTVTIIQLILV